MRRRKRGKKKEGEEETGKRQAGSRASQGAERGSGSQVSGMGERFEESGDQICSGVKMQGCWLSQVKGTQRKPRQETSLLLVNVPRSAVP